MLPVHEFAEAYSRHYRRGRWVFYPLAAASLFGPLIAFGDDLFAPDGRLRTSLRPYLFDNLIFIAVGLPLAFLPTALGMAFARGVFDRLSRSDAHLICPHCRGGLALTFDRVIATRVCPHCTQRVLFDPFPAEPIPLTRRDADSRATGGAFVAVAFGWCFRRRSWPYASERYRARELFPPTG